MLSVGISGRLSEGVTGSVFKNKPDFHNASDHRWSCGEHWQDTSKAETIPLSVAVYTLVYVTDRDRP